MPVARLLELMAGRRLPDYRLCQAARAVLQEGVTLTALGVGLDWDDYPASATIMTWDLLRLGAEAELAARKIMGDDEIESRSL